MYYLSQLQCDDDDDDDDDDNVDQTGAIKMEILFNKVMITRITMSYWHSMWLC